MNARPEVFRRAADLIRQNGLHKSSYKGADGSMCTVWAVTRGAGEVYCQFVRPELELLGDMLGHKPKFGPADWVQLVSWSDAPERTPQDVITLLEQAEEKAQADR